VTALITSNSSMSRRASSTAGRELRAFFALLVCFAGATCSAGVLHVWAPRRGGRKDFTRCDDAPLLQSILELVTAGGWALTSLGWRFAPWMLIGTPPISIVGPLGAWFYGRAWRNL
jgi:hypothetical protein